MLQITDLIHEHKGVAREALIEHIEDLMDNALIEAIKEREDIVKVCIYSNYDGYNSMLEIKYKFDTDRISKIKEKTITFEIYQYVLKKIIERYIEAGYPLRYDISGMFNNYIKFVGLKELVFNS